MISMESDNSMDDQSWKRHKRARLEDVSNEVNERNSSGNNGNKPYGMCNTCQKIRFLSKHRHP